MIYYLAMTGFPFSFSSVSVQHIFHVSLHLTSHWQPLLMGLLPGNSLSLCNNSHKYRKSIRQMIISGAPIWQFCSKLLSNPCYYCNTFHIIRFFLTFPVSAIVNEWRHTKWLARYIQHYWPMKINSHSW